VKNSPKNPKRTELDKMDNWTHKVQQEHRDIFCTYY